jgi:hypothetical protein
VTADELVERLVEINRPDATIVLLAEDELEADEEYELTTWDIRLTHNRIELVIPARAAA